MHRVIAAIVVGVLAAMAPIAAFAQAGGGGSGSITTSFSVNTRGFAVALPLNGQATCSVIVYSAGTGLTMVPLASSDGGTTNVTVTTINNGAITTFGTFQGNVAPFGLNQFSLNITALTSGTVSGTVTCSPAIGALSQTGTNSTNITQIGAGGTLPSTRGLPTTPFQVANTVGQGCIGESTQTGTLVPSANQSIALVASTTQQIVGAVASTVIHVCNFDISAALTAGGTFSLEYGTGTLCGTGTVVFANYAFGVTTVDIGRGTGSQDLFSIPSAVSWCIVSPAFVGSAFLNAGDSQF